MNASQRFEALRLSLKVRKLALEKKDPGNPALKYLQKDLWHLEALEVEHKKLLEDYRSLRAQVPLRGEISDQGIALYAGGRQ